MSDLTEAEIFDCLVDNFKKAAVHAEDLAKLPKKGPTYARLREELKLVEGAARQAAYWRQDARWLQIGLYMEEAHQRAGNWLRGIRNKSTGMWEKLPEGQTHPYFMKLAENLRAGLKLAEGYRDNRTGRVGMILPASMNKPAPARDSRAYGYAGPVEYPAHDARAYGAAGPASAPGPDAARYEPAPPVRMTPGGIIIP
jgi:hypothetical protein